MTRKELIWLSVITVALIGVGWILLGEAGHWAAEKLVEMRGL